MPGYEFQIHRYLADVASGHVSVIESKTFIVVGDSTASRALPLSEGTTGSARSFAVHGGTILDSYFLLRRYLERHQPPPCLVLMNSYGAAAHNYPERFWSLFVRQNFYRPRELEELYALSSRLDAYPARDYSYPTYRLRIAQETVFNLFDWRTVSNFVFKPYSTREARQRYRLARRGNGSMPWQRDVGKPSPSTTAYQDHLFQDFVIDPLADDAIARLQAHHWPANLRELRNVLRYAAEGRETIRAADLPDFEKEKADFRATRAAFETLLKAKLETKRSP